MELQKLLRFKKKKEERKGRGRKKSCFQLLLLRHLTFHKVV